LTIHKGTKLNQLHQAFKKKISIKANIKALILYLRTSEAAF